MDTLKQAVEEFLKSKKYIYGFNKDTVERLLRGNSTKELKKQGEKVKITPYAFLNQGDVRQCENMPVDDPSIWDTVGSGIKESTFSYVKEKNIPIAIYKSFVNFLREKYGVNILLEFPPLFESSFDRQMFIVKALHEKGVGVTKLEEKLWISDRTIEEDLHVLREQEGISFLGQRVKINGIQRKNGVIEFKSTVHPVFLALNLTQVVVMLEGLKNMMKEEAYKGYAFRLAVSIWKELSDYGRRRISEVSEMLSLDINWYDELSNSKNPDLFFTEDECSDETGLGNILNFYKNGEECAIEYSDSDGKPKIIYPCHIRNYDFDTKEVTISINTETFILKAGVILNIRKNLKDIY
ncbi:MAG: hypothetical protein ACREV6_02790 [Clostridium sp.]|uniref:hypothetical protein n=1 Tax=Clostridium sp. TaxID=1506 RepID=UPI003D6D6CE4